MCELLSKVTCIHVVGYDSVWATAQTNCRYIAAGVWVLLRHISSQSKHLAEGTRGRTGEPFGMFLREEHVLGGAVVMALYH